MSWETLEAEQSETLARQLREKSAFSKLIGESRSFLEQIGKIPSIARSQACVLVSGETGTGKEVVARAIHYLSPRAGGPFVPVNCGALPDELVESELFGHERAAFTGAVAARAGLIEEAAGGTLFLDEIDSLPAAAQSSLLRFLQDGELRRLGTTKLRKSDARVIAASNVDLERALAQGQLRRDLYYRLNVLPIHLPPLRERAADIPLLAEHFLRKHAEASPDAPACFSPGVIEALTRYSWPGNVRELEHLVQRAVVLCGGKKVIGCEDLGLSPAPAAGRAVSFQQAKARVIADFEQAYLSRLLAEHAGNISHAAQAARKNRRAFFELLRKHHIDAARYRARS